MEKSQLPALTAFDHPRRFDAFLNAVSWGSVSSADEKALQAPFRSGVDVDDYQLDPVVRALSMPRVNLLVADDVGLGKTIEAGLLAQELILRHRVRAILIVCPSFIQMQWKEEMRDKFGLDFRIVDSELLRELRRRRGIHVNPWCALPPAHQGVSRIFAAPRRCYVVRFVDNQEIIPPGEGGLIARWQGLTKNAYGPLSSEKVN